MVLAPLTPEQQATARKLATPVDGADDQGPAADPAFMQTLFSRLLMILGAVNPLFVPVLLAVNVLTENVDFAALVQSSAEDLVAADPGADSLTAAQRLQIQGHYDNPDFPHGAHTWTVLGNSAANLLSYLVFATEILHSLLGHSGSLFRMIAGVPRAGFLAKCKILLESFYIQAPAELARLRGRFASSVYVAGSSMDLHLRELSSLRQMIDVRAHPRVMDARTYLQQVFDSIVNSGTDRLDTAVAHMSTVLEGARVTERQVTTCCRRLTEMARAKWPTTNRPDGSTLATAVTDSLSAPPHIAAAVWNKVCSVCHGHGHDATDCPLTKAGRSTPPRPRPRPEQRTSSPVSKRQVRFTDDPDAPSARQKKDAAYKKKLADDKAAGKPPPSPCPNMIRQPDGSSRKCGGNHWASDCPSLSGGTVGAVLIGTYEPPFSFQSAVASAVPDLEMVSVWFLRLFTCVALLVVIATPASTPLAAEPVHNVLAILPMGALPAVDCGFPPVWTVGSATHSDVHAVVSAPADYTDRILVAFAHVHAAVGRGAAHVTACALNNRLVSAFALVCLLVSLFPCVTSALMRLGLRIGTWIAARDDDLDFLEWRIGRWHGMATGHLDGCTAHTRAEARARLYVFNLIYGASVGAIVSALISGLPVPTALCFGLGVLAAGFCLVARWGQWWRYDTVYFTAIVAAYLLVIWACGAGLNALLFGLPSALLVAFHSLKSATRALPDPQSSSSIGLTRWPGVLRRLVYLCIVTACCVYGFYPPSNSAPDLPLVADDAAVSSGTAPSWFASVGSSSGDWIGTAAPAFPPSVGSATPTSALLARASKSLTASQLDLQRRFGDWGSWMLDTGSPFHITPFASDIAEWTNTTPTPLRGLGDGGSMYSIGSGTVRLASLDSNNNTVYEEIHDVLVVPQSQLRIKGVHLEVKAGNHLNTRSMCIDRADGCSVPFQVTPEGHYVQQGVALHHHRPANVPGNCPIDTTGRSSVSGAQKGGSAASTNSSNSASNSCAHEKGGSSSGSARTNSTSCGGGKGGSSSASSAAASSGSGSDKWSPPALGDITYALADARTGYSNRTVLSQFGRHPPRDYFAPAYAAGHARRAALSSTGRDANDANAFSIDWKGTFAAARGLNGAKVVLGVKHLGSKYLRLYHFDNVSTANAITAVDDFRNHMATKYDVRLSRCLMDRDSTFVSPSFTRHLESVGINPDFGGAEDHWELGSIESLWRRWACFVISALKAAALDETYWGFASEMFEELHNNLPHAGNSGSMSPLAVLDAAPPDLTHLRAPFCPAYVLDHNTTSLQERARVGIFVGYPIHTRNGVWRVYFPDTKSVQTTRHVRFDEHAVVSGASNAEKRTAHDQVVAEVDALVERMQRRPASPRARGGRGAARSAVQPLVQAAISDDKFVVCNASVIDKATGYIRDRCIAMHGRRVSDCIGMHYAKGDKQLAVKRRDLEYDMRRSWIGVSTTAPPPFAPVAVVSAGLREFLPSDSAFMPPPAVVPAADGSIDYDLLGLVSNNASDHGNAAKTAIGSPIGLHADELSAIAAVHESGIDVDFVAEIITPEGSRCLQLRHGPATAQSAAPVIPGPRSVAAARRDRSAAEWLRAFQSEVMGLFDFGALHWEVCPPDHKPLRTQCVFVLKLDALGNPTRYKARLVIDGSKQRPGEFAEVNATSASIGTFKRQCAACAELGGTLRGGDFQLAYVHAPQPVQQWLHVPDGICREYDADGRPMHLRVDKALYGDKGAAGLWCIHIHNWLMRYGFERCETDPGLYRLRRSQRRRESVSVPVTTSPTEEQPPAQRAQPLSFSSNADSNSIDEDFFTLVLYTDDTSACVPPGAGCDALYKDFVSDLQVDFRFEDKGPLRDFLSFSVEQPEPGVVILDQTFYAKNLAAQHGFGDGTQATHVPAPPGSLPHEADCANPAASPIDVTAFRSRVGGALWLARCTRPDISFATNSLARVSHAPGVNHWHSSSHLLRYIATHPESRIEYRRNGRPAFIYVDSDFLPDCGSVAVNRRATTGFAACLAGACVGHRSSRQVAVATSTAASEYVAAFDAARFAVRLRKQLRFLGLPQVEPTCLLEDNHACIKICKSSTTSPRLQHLDGRFHWLKEQVLFDKSVSLHYVPTGDQCADCLTKNLSRTKLRRFAASLNGTSPLAPPIDSPPGRIGISLTNPASFPSLDLL